MSTPPSEYSAEKNVGIIKINTSKKIAPGWKANFANYTIKGEYWSNVSSGFVNYHGKKFDFETSIIGGQYNTLNKCQYTNYYANETVETYKKSVIFGYQLVDPTSYGVVEFDKDGKIYNQIKDANDNIQKERNALATSGLVSSKMKEKGEIKEKPTMTESAAPKAKRLLFKKTTFLNEAQMLSRIPAM